MTPKTTEQAAIVPPSPEAPREPPRQLPAAATATSIIREVGGPAGPEPTRYGDWELRGRCVDF